MNKTYSEKVDETINGLISGRDTLYRSLKMILPEIKRGVKRIDRKLEHYDGKRETTCRESTMDKYFYYIELSDDLHRIVSKIESCEN